MREVPRPTPRDIREQFKPVSSSVVRAALVPALIFMVNAAACTPAKGVEPQIQPTAAAVEMSPTGVPTEAVPTAAPTESPKPVPAIETSPREALEKVQSLINMVKSPDPSIATQYNLSEDRIKSNQQNILDGAPDRRIPGLLGIKVTVEQGDTGQAKKQLEQIFKAAVLYRTVLPDFSDRVRISDEEKQQYDPEYRYFAKDASVVVSAINKEVALKMVEALYFFDGKATGGKG